jgi:RNA recognition motif-containing protein
MKLLIRNLNRITTESDLRTMFESYGSVQSCSLVKDNSTGASKGFAFVEMPKVGEAKAAIKNLNYNDVDGNRIRVKKAESKKTLDSNTDNESVEDR